MELQHDADVFATRDAGMLCYTDYVINTDWTAHIGKTRSGVAVSDIRNYFRNLPPNSP